MSLFRIAPRIIRNALSMKVERFKNFIAPFHPVSLLFKADRTFPLWLHLWFKILNILVKSVFSSEVRLIFKETEYLKEPMKLTTAFFIWRLLDIIKISAVLRVFPNRSLLSSVRQILKKFKLEKSVTQFLFSKTYINNSVYYYFTKYTHIYLSSQVSGKGRDENIKI